MKQNTITDTDAIVADLPVAVFRTTPDSRIVAGNPALAELIGAESVADLVDIDVRSLYIDPKARDHMRSRIANSGTIPPEEIELSRLDGRTIWVRVSTFGVFDDAGEVAFYQGVLEDVTESRRTDAELMRSNALLDTLTNVQSRFIAGVDPGELFDHLLEDLLSVTESEYGFIAQVHHNDDGSPFLRTWAMTNIAWNEATRRMYDEHGPRGMEFHSLDNLFGRAVTEKAHIISNDPLHDDRQGGRPYGHPPLDSFLAIPVLKAGDVAAVIALSNRPAGYDEALVDHLQPVVATVGSMIEAIRGEQARRDAEERERGQQELYRAVVEHASEAVLAFRDDGIIEAFNPAAEAMSGYSEAEMVGGNVARFIPAGSFDEYRRLAAENSQAANELMVKSRNGRLVPVEVSIGRTNVGSRVLLTAIVRNIAERKAFEAALLNAKEAAERTSRAKDEFLAAMSHELRTPLNAVIGLSMILRRQTHGPVNEKQTQYLEQVEAAGRHLLELINDILDLAKIEADELEPELATVSLNPLAVAAVSVVQEQALAKGVRMEVDCCESLPPVVADARRTKQVLLNLLSNAIKFTAPGGRIGVRGRIEGDQLAVEVWDSGIGIPEGELDNLFVPFKQLDHSLAREHEGTGLGLALTRKLVDMQGGTLNVASAVDHGSTFTFTLPLAVGHDDGPGPVADIDGTGDSVGTAVRVLVVEDNEVNRMMVIDVLEAAGYVTEVAEDGEQVEGVFAEFGPDVVLMDVQLPKRDGLSVTRALKADHATKDIPVIALTALAMKGDEDRCLEAGCDAYLSKPCDPDELLEAIRSVLGKTPSPVTHGMV